MYEAARVAHGIEIVEHLGAMRLDLRKKNIFERRLRSTVLARPGALQALVVTVGEEGIGGPIEDRQEVGRRRTGRRGMFASARRTSCCRGHCPKRGR